MKKYRPTKAEKDIIKACAQLEAGMKGVTLEVGERYRLGGGIPSDPCTINIALLTDDDDLNGTDLNQSIPWKWFTMGFPFAEGGRAICDFYIYNKSRDELEIELQSNVTAFWRDGKMIRVNGVSGTIWENNKWVRLGPFNRDVNPNIGE